MMVVMSPLMIGLLRAAVRAGLGLYWFIGNCVSIIQPVLRGRVGSLRPKGGSSPISQPKGAGPPRTAVAANAKQLPRRVQGGGKGKNQGRQEARVLGRRGRLIEMRSTKG